MSSEHTTSSDRAPSSAMSSTSTSHALIASRVGGALALGGGEVTASAAVVLAPSRPSVLKRPLGRTTKGKSSGTAERDVEMVPDLPPFLPPFPQIDEHVIVSSLAVVNLRGRMYWQGVLLTFLDNHRQLDSSFKDINPKVEHGTRATNLQCFILFIPSFLLSFFSMSITTQCTLRRPTIFTEPSRYLGFETGV